MKLYNSRQVIVLFSNTFKIKQVIEQSYDIWQNKKDAL